jgi:hypothetical protein
MTGQRQHQASQQPFEVMYHQMEAAAEKALEDIECLDGRIRQLEQERANKVIMLESIRMSQDHFKEMMER